MARHVPDVGAGYYRFIMAVFLLIAGQSLVSYCLFFNDDPAEVMNATIITEAPPSPGACAFWKRRDLMY